MSVLIKGMEMPSGCLSCDFCNPFVDEPYCRRLMRRTPKVTRLEDCPLVHVPSHGRLIDADALNNMINRSYPMTDRIDVHNGYAICQEMIKQLPTIIEAEEGER